MGIQYLSLVGLYFVLNITNYKVNNKSNEIRLSDTELKNMDIELSKLITEGKKLNQ